MNSIINGLIIDTRSKQGAMHAIVEAWEQDVKYPDLVGKESTDASGRFRMRFDEKHWKDNSRDKNPKIFFKVYDAFGNLLRDTRNQVYWTAEQKENDIVIGIGMGLEDAGHTIKGTILLANGKAAVDVSVQAFFNTFKSDKKAGMAVQTNTTGGYVIVYKPEPKSNHLSIKVYSPDGVRLLAESETVYKAGAQETINLSLPDSAYDGSPEFERILAAVISETGNSDITKLPAKKLRLLAADTGFTRNELQRLQASQLIAKDYGGLLAPVAYALILSKGSDTSGSNLFDLPTADFSHVIAEATRTCVIAPLNLKLLKQQQELYQSIRIRLFMDTPAFESKTSLAGLWTAAAFTKPQQQKISEKYLAAKGDNALFWSSVEKDSILKPLAARLKLSTGLHNLSLGNTALVKLLLANKQVTALESLAAWTEDLWLNTLNDKAVSASIPKEIPGKGLAEKKASYARSMKRMVEYLFPTKALQAHLQASTHYSGNFKSDLGVFIKNNPGFAIEKNNVTGYLRKNKTALNGVKNKEELSSGLETLSLRYAMAPAMDKYEHVQRLGTMGISSSLEVMNMGNAQFTRQYSALGGKQTEAQEIFDNARHVANAAQLTLIQRTDLINLPSVLSDIKQDATWQNLFGPEDYCQCKECRSVYSPAAYLADLLHFLQKRELRAGNTAYHVLMKRRPDIKNILLNCDNAHTSLPYIDLVNEILEHAVTGTEEFNHQTSGTDAERRSVPEYVHEAAYDKLLATAYPWNLPFDLKTETGRAFLKHLGVSHTDLVSLFYQPDNAGSLSRELSVALSRVGLTGTEWETMESTYYSPNEHKLWKYSAGTNLDEALKEVESFLQRTQLSYDELRALLKTKYINPDGILRIEFIKTCDLTSANFSNMKKASRKKIYSFTRLYRKLSLSIADLDKVLTGLNIPEMNEAGMIRLAEFMEVLSASGLPVSELVSWFGLIPTRWIGAKDQEQELYEQVFLNKTIVSGSRSDTTSIRSKFLLNATNDELSRVIEKTDEEAINYIAAALQITKEEVNLLTTHFGFSKYSLSALSLLFASASYSTFLGTSINEYIALSGYMGLSEGSGVYNKKMTDAAALLKRTGIRFADLAFLLSPTGNDEETQRINNLYDELRKGIIGKFNPSDPAALQAPLTLNDLLIASLSASLPVKKKTLKAYPDLENRLATLSASNGDEAILFLKELSKAAYLFNLLNFPEAIEQRLVWHHAIRFSEFSFDTLALILEIKTLQPLIVNAGTGLLGRINHIMDSVALSKIKSYLSKGLELNEGVLDTLISRAWKTNAAFSTSHLKQALEFKRIISLFGFTKETDLTHLLSLSSLFFEKEHLDVISSIAKSKHGMEAWLGISKKLRDPLREKQRDGLSSYLLAHHKHPGFASIEDLYSYYLIDTQMSACMQSSRILLAISTAQLFIQRCLMNLEPEVDQSHMTDPIAKENELNEWGEWLWRKNYRVWEANRKVFLYPENWLEPEWRDDKTPFFKELEEEMMQGDLTNNLAEQAYLNYLNKLDAVSNLEIMAMCEAGEPDTYYIFGRTHSDPKEYYFRKYVKHPQRFSAWEKIDLDITGDHVVPHVHNKKLYLFWANFQEQHKRNKPEEREPESAEPESSKFWRIRLEWSNYRSGSWSAKKVSRDYIDGRPENVYYGYNSLNDMLKYTLASAYSVEEKIIVNFYGWSTFGDVSDFNLGDLIFNTAKNTVSSPGITDPATSGTEPFELSASTTYLNLELFKPPVTALSFGFLRQKLTRGIIHANDHVTINELTLFSKILQRAYLIPVYEVRDKNNDDTPDTIFANVYNHPFIYQDARQIYLIKNSGMHYSFIPVNHGSVYEMMQTINAVGLSNFLTSYDATSVTEIKHAFTETYTVASDNVLSLPKEHFQTLYHEPNSQYNWELFFHIPMMIANKLSTEQKFDEARNWYHYIFNPTLRSEETSAKRFWKFRPFYNLAGTTSIGELMGILNEESGQAGDNGYETAVSLWEQDAFNPHLVARTRIIAYMKHVVMKYIDNLVSWADNLFRQDTMESLNEATQLYMLAWNILGREPVILNSNEVTDKSYDALSENGLDAFSNSMFRYVETRMYHSTQRRQEQERQSAMRQYLDFSKQTPARDSKAGVAAYGKSPVTLGYMRELLYFCLPPNPKLLGYWDLLKDRFYKLRHCRNIEGVVRQLPLYEPPIDPALLIKAKQSGLSLEEVREGLYNTHAHYRFAYLLIKAIDYVNDVRSLGTTLLSALEKRDAEAFSLLRAGHEANMLNAITTIKKNQVRELSESAKSLSYSLSMANKRYEYYATRERLSAKENSQFRLMKESNKLQTISQTLSALSAMYKAIPDIGTGVAGWGGFFSTFLGGGKQGSISEMYATMFSLQANIMSMKASETGQMASYERRYEDWQHQVDLATDEIEQVNKQILAAEIRMSIAEKELDNHTLQIEQSKEQQDVLQSKFTNKELYNWMVSQTKTLYFQCYQMAFDMAKKAEKALNYELGNSDETFIKYGYWDNLKEGLLSGDKLLYDLKRMEKAYLERNKRLHEISKTISLAMIDAKELIRLRETGTCHISIPVFLFDLDFLQKENGTLYNRHTNRKIKSVSLTMPCVTGPYTGVNCVLTAGGQSIATSSAQNDSGMFQFNFNDERYLPFEGLTIEGGLTFVLNMNDEYRAFDYNSISDVLLHINYTAEEGKTAFDPAGLQFTKLFSVKHEFSNEWFEAKNSGQLNTVTIPDKILPYLSKGKVDQVAFRYALVRGADYESTPPLPEPGAAESIGSGLPSVSISNGTFQLGLNVNNLVNVDDVLLAVSYTIE